jgi:hypothetical protein
MFEGKQEGVRDTALEEEIVKSTQKVRAREEFDEKAKTYLEKFKNHGDHDIMDYLLSREIDEIIKDKKGKIPNWELGQMLDQRLVYMNSVDPELDLTEERTKTKEEIKNLS